MSHHDEFHDLEARVRQSKPDTEPMPPALKRRMRAELLEKTDMQRFRLNLAKLGTALVALVVIVGVPLYFVSIQMSVQSQQAAGPGDGAVGAVESKPPAEAPAQDPAEDPAGDPVEEPMEEPAAAPATPTPIPVTIPAEEGAESEAVLADPASSETTAVLLNIGEPQPYEGTDVPPEATFYDVEITAEYNLVGYEEGYLHLNITGDSGSGQYSTPITEGEGIITSSLRLSDVYVTAEGELRESVETELRIDAFDAETEAFVNVYPGDGVVLAQDAPYPHAALGDQISLAGVSLQREGTETALVALFSYSLADGAETAVVMAEAVAADGTLLGSGTITSTEEGDTLLALPLTLETVPDPDDMFRIELALVRNGRKDIGQMRDISLAYFEAAESENIWLIPLQPEVNSGMEATILPMVVGYYLPETYTEGFISFSSRYEDPNANHGGGGGGGGGGGQPVVVGLPTIVFSFSHTVSNESGEWPESFSAEARLMGLTAEGEMEEVGTAVWPEPAE